MNELDRQRDLADIAAKSPHATTVVMGLLKPNWQEHRKGFFRVHKEKGRLTDELSNNYIPPMVYRQRT